MTATRALPVRVVLMGLLSIGCVAEWTHYANVNCYDGHGADDLEIGEGQTSGVMSLDKCKEKCEEMPSCQGITMETATGKCYRRGSISISSCDQGGPTADGYDTWVVPETKPIWGFATSSNISTSPVSGSDGTVFVVSNSTLYAIHANGTLRWEVQPFAGGHIVAPPVIGDDGTIYVISCSIANIVSSVQTCYNMNTSVQGLGTSLYAVDSAGNTKWQFDSGAGSMIQQPPLFHGKDTINILTGNGGEWKDGDKGALHVVHTSDGTHIFDSVEFDGTPYSPAVAADGAVYITTFIGCFPKCVPSCSFVRVSNGTKDVLDQEIVNLDNGGCCQGPKIGTDGSIYALIGDLKMWNASGHLAWTFSDPRSRPIQAFALGPDDVACVHTGHTWGPDEGSLAAYGVTTRGELKWTHIISTGKWNNLMISPNGQFSFVEVLDSCCTEGSIGRTSLVMLDPFVGNVSSNITVQGYLSGTDHFTNVHVMGGKDGTVALSGCVALDFNVPGHKVLYVFPKQGLRPWSFTLGGCATGIGSDSKYTLSGVATDGSVYLADRSILYKLDGPSKQALLHIGLPIFV